MQVCPCAADETVSAEFRCSTSAHRFPRETRVPPCRAGAPDELRILSEYLGSRRDACPALFASNRKTEIKRNQIFNVVGKYGIAVALPKWKCHPHALRHSIAIHLLSAGVSLDAVRDWMGHATIQSTEIYAKAIAMHHGTEIGRPFSQGRCEW